MTTQIDERSAPPTKAGRDGETSDRVVALSLRVAPELAFALVDALAEAVQALTQRFGVHAVNGPVVASRETECVSEVIVEINANPSDRDVALSSIIPGDVVQTWIPGKGQILARVMAVTPRNQFGDGPYFALEGVEDLMTSVTAPKNELERRLWHLQPGDELEYWCADRRDKRGRNQSAQWHEKGFGCKGGGLWHRARVTKVSWSLTGRAGDEFRGVFTVFGSRSTPNTLSCVVTLSPDSDLLQFTWPRQFGG